MGQGGYVVQEDSTRLKPRVVGPMVGSPARTSEKERELFRGGASRRQAAADAGADGGFVPFQATDAVEVGCGMESPTTAIEADGVMQRVLG